LSSFAACGGSQPPATSPEPAAAASSNTSGAAASSPAASAPATGSPSLAAAPSAPPVSPAPPQTPDRNMDDIRAIVGGNRDAFRACYEKSLKAHPGIKGRFMMKFVVSPEGTIKSAESDVAKSEIRAPDLEACAVGVLKGLKFPPSKKGMESTVN